MLTRCPRCGKPVYAPGGRTRVECGYCYQFFDLAQPLSPLEPESVDWKKPIYEAVSGITRPGEMCRWLALLGSYADAPQRLEQVRRAEQNRFRDSREALKAAAEAAQVERILYDLEQMDRSLCAPEELDRVLKAAREKHSVLKQQEDWKKLQTLAATVQLAVYAHELDASVLSEIESLLHLPGAAEVLEAAKAKRASLLRAKDIERLARLRESIEDASTTEMTDALIAALMKISPLPEREAALAMAYKKRSLLLQKEAADKSRKEKREKRKKCLLRLLPFFGVALLCCYVLLSIHVFQPGRLEKAAELMRAGAYAEAEEVYLSLLSPAIFRNQSVAAQAREALPQLRNQWAAELAEQGDLKAALEKYQAAGNEEAARKTAMAYAEALAEQGRTDDAVAVLEGAGSDPEILDLLRAMYVQQADQTGKKVIGQWTGEGTRIGDDAYQALAEAGSQFQNVDAQLHYWGLLADAGIDLTRVYPDGVQISGFSLPKECTVFSKFDAAKPLFIQRREDEYYLSPMNISSNLPFYSHHDSDGSDHYTVTLLPECWQRLPRERRAASLQEVTSIFAVNLTFPPAGSCYGQYRARNYFYHQPGRPAPSPTTVTKYAYFPLYHAKMELLLWKYPGSDIMVLWSKTNVPRLDGTSSTPMVIIDWTQYPIQSVSATKAGLAGAFDEGLICAVLHQTYEKLLNAGEE